jgi:hypothetical protein
MVKCSDCGFLAVRDMRSRQLVEMEQGYRIKGQSPQVIDFSPHFNIYDEPRCFVRAFDLREEVKKDTRQCSLQEKILSVINCNRNCKSFTKWHQGFTPKEHQEMIDRESMLKRQADIEDADRKWRTRQQWYMVIIAGIFTILGGIIALLARGCS